MEKRGIIFLVLFLLLVFSSSTQAHVPYIEFIDYSESRPFTIRDSVENSKAIYAWLKTGQDIDVYTFEVTEPVRVVIDITVQKCEAFEDLLPWFALVGPGLPEPDEEIPFELSEGTGAIVWKNVELGETRNEFWEPIGGKCLYWLGVDNRFDQDISVPGTYYIYYWDPDGFGGDYIASIGFLEGVNTRLDDLITRLISPLIKLNLENHTRCPKTDRDSCAQ
jgi:hypothetical protein